MKQISNFRICTRCDTFVIRRYWIRTKDCTLKEETMVGSWADRSTSVQEWSSGEGETDGGFRKWKLNSSHDGIQTFILIIEKKFISPKTHVVCLKKNGRRLEWKWSSLGWKSRNPDVSVSLCDSDLIVNGNFYQSFNSVEIWGCMQTQIMFSLDFCYPCRGDFLSGEYRLANGMIKFDEPPVVCWWVYSSTVRGSNWEM